MVKGKSQKHLFLNTRIAPSIAILLTGCFLSLQGCSGTTIVIDDAQQQVLGEIAIVASSQSPEVDLSGLPASTGEAFGATTGMAYV